VELVDGRRYIFAKLRAAQIGYIPAEGLGSLFVFDVFRNLSSKSFLTSTSTDNVENMEHEKGCRG
jgi:hypothetical protein